MTVALRLTVLEYNADCMVCGGRLPKGQLVNVVDGRRLVHVGRCSEVVRAAVRAGSAPGESRSPR